MTAADDVAARLGRLEDADQIRRLFVAYQSTLDDRDFAGYSMLFAPDGEFVAGAKRVRGRPAIRAFVERIMGTERGRDFHVLANPAIDFESPDRARAQLTWIFTSRGDNGEPTVARLGHYEDVLVRRDGRWMFLSRSAPMDLPDS
jgi:uncharacterized protein (TIGR02246 family)